jgi:hypothetical protein
MTFSLTKKRVLIGIKYKVLLLFIAIVNSYFGQGIDSLPWIQVGKEVYYCEIDAPQKSILGDSKLTLVKINPSFSEFELKSATIHNQSIPLPVNVWADTFGFDLVVNAGMYDLLKPLASKGFFKIGDQFNNQQINTSYNGLFAVNNKGVGIIDLKCDATFDIRKQHSCFQGMRMLDCDGEKMDWKKKKQSCSMLVASIDTKGNVYFIFSRSPYLHATFIDFLKMLPLELTTTIYLEGGPETSLYLRTPSGIIQKVGSYISGSYENDNNMKFWRLPNVIGVKFHP